MTTSEEPDVWIDISRKLRNGIPTWPGDRPFRLETRRDGGIVLSWFSTTCHIGTHVDAPLHMEGEGATVDEIPLGRFLGPAEVVVVAGAPRRIRRENLPAGWQPQARRVLFATGTQPAGVSRIHSDLSGISSDLVAFLADHGVILVGIDTPSVDPFDSEDFEAHHALAGRGITWIEGLNLEGVSPGQYELVALPMGLTGTEAAPVRAILRKK
ncbi:MAG: hypothetical protein GXP48_10410 [Acidobacteria bacterium]|nr:hypothetical protein [Acidobacteriota bacterium]